MARPLNKRQRKEVRQILHAAFPSEWKLLELKQGELPVDIDSNGTGTDLVASITQGTGASNRIGNSIRLKRLEIYYTWRSPTAPKLRSPIRCGNLIYRRQNTAVTFLGAMAGAWETALVPSPFFLYGPAPMIRDLESRGINIRRMRRHRVMGEPDEIQVMKDRLLGVNGNPQAVGEAASLAATAAGGGGRVGFDTILGTPGTFDLHLPMQQRDRDCGEKLELHRLVMKWPGAGLLVTFADASLSIVDANHLYYLVSSEVGSGIASVRPEECPFHSMGMRLWFTDE